MKEIGSVRGIAGRTTIAEDASALDPIARIASALGVYWSISSRLLLGSTSNRRYAFAG